MKTKIGIYSELFGGDSDSIRLIGNNQFKVEISLDGDADYPVAVVRYGENTVRIKAEQKFVVKHTFAVEAVKDLAEEILPLKIIYRGQEYRLNKTKSGKLVLNK